MLRGDRKDEGSETEDKMNAAKVNLNIEKNRDGKTGKTHFYFQYPEYRFLTKEEYQKEYSGIMEI